MPQLVFPVVGPVTYRDDFGEPRAKWPHPGNDLMAEKRQIAVAAEPGKIMFWTHSATAGCMLYLYGKSGTTYQYIHLNNDLTDGNDNRGKCVAGTAYAPGLKDGATVQAGQPVGFVGDSGDAERHPSAPPLRGAPERRAAGRSLPVSCAEAVHLLVPVDPKTTVSLSVEGQVKSTTANRLTLAVGSLTLFPGAQKLTGVARTIVLSVPGTAQIDAGDGTLGSADSTALTALDGRNVVVLTSPAKATLAVALARPGAISASRIARSTQGPSGGP